MPLNLSIRACEPASYCRFATWCVRFCVARADNNKIMKIFPGTGPGSPIPIVASVDESCAMLGKRI
jgi:hypothetical protein